jgi:hypothetical protein
MFARACRRCFAPIHFFAAFFLTISSRRRLQYAAPALMILLGTGLSWASFSLTFQGLVQTLNTGGSISLSSLRASCWMRRATSLSSIPAITASWK